MVLPTVYAAFPERAMRSRFVAERFGKYLGEGVLDVGCFEAPLREILGGSAYTGVDMAGRPDIRLNLEQVERLPFDDGAFKAVICIDVLEHLDNLHSMFAELVRVSGSHVIVSLPNCWCDARRPIERGRGKFGHYGLPAQRPLDRHKWFFGLTEAREFVDAKAAEFGLAIEELFVTEKPRNPLVRLVRRLRYPGVRYQNRYSATLWVVLRKPS